MNFSFSVPSWTSLCICSFLCFLSYGCEEETEDEAISNVETSSKSLMCVDAELAATIVYPSSLDTSSVEFPELCIGPPNAGQQCRELRWTNCYTVGSDLICFYSWPIDNPNLSWWIGDSSQPDADHPFVNTPDDWDWMSIHNSSDNSFSIKSVNIKVLSRPCDSTSYPPENTYTFVDKTTLSSTVVPGGSLFLNDYIQERRECVFKTSLCRNQVSSVGSLSYYSKVIQGPIDDCLPTAYCSNRAEIPYQDGSPLYVADVDLTHYPQIIKEAVKDIGQLGVSKWNVFDRNEAWGHSCFEPVGYLLTRYTNNLYSCNENSPLCHNSVDPMEDNDPSSPCCSYFKYWMNDGSGNNFIWHNQFDASGRGAILLADYKNSDGKWFNYSGCGNLENYTICRLDDSGAPEGTFVSTTCSVNGTSVSFTYFSCNSVYEPKAGDLFNRGGTMGHVMVWAGNKPRIHYNYIGGSSYAFVFGAPIFQKGGPFQSIFMGATMDSLALASKQVRDGVAAQSITENIFYFGEVDHEKGGGKNSPFIHTQNQILTLLN